MVLTSNFDIVFKKEKEKKKMPGSRVIVAQHDTKTAQKQERKSQFRCGSVPKRTPASLERSEELIVQRQPAHTANAPMIILCPSR